MKFFSKYKLAVAPILVVGFVVISAASVATVIFAHGGDSSLHHACVGNVNGRLTIVGVNDTCGQNETAMDWIKDVFAGSGLTIDRGSTGATLSANTTYLQRRVSSSCTAGSAIKAIASDGTVTCESVTASVTRYNAGGSGVSSPNGSWQDVPNATITQTFSAGTIKATYAGSITMQNGDGTAYVRLKVLPTGGSASYVGDVHVFRSSSPSTSEYSNAPFTSQAVISISAGEYSITPQININNSSWGLYYVNNLIVEQ